MYNDKTNLCQSCVHDSYCSLTTQKHTVWDCSDFNEMRNDQDPIEKPVIKKKKKELAMAMV